MKKICVMPLLKPSVSACAAHGVTLQLESAVGLLSLLLVYSVTQSSRTAPSSRGSASPGEQQEFGELWADEQEKAGSVRECRTEQGLGTSLSDNVRGVV